MTTEDRLRGALRQGTPRALDGQAIIAAAKRRRAMGLARVGTVAAALVLVAGFGVATLRQTAFDAQPESGSVYATPPAAVPGPVEDERGGPEMNSGVIPGRRLLVHPERWCLVRSGDGGEIGCAPRTERMLRVPDERDEQWLVVLAPSGPDTTVLQVEQRAGWLNLRTSSVPGSGELWVGVLPGSQVPEPPRGARALNASGQAIWSG
ncbi:hypothetical protein [Granulicoccus sp. GXG6511]|uniref:hypothetical protein n=1 Tax=Granulicoccus sp. GXG6511 TaxID=3381351 RepID=UPI003D7E9AB4